MSSKARTLCELMSLSTNLQPPPRLIPFGLLYSKFKFWKKFQLCSVQLRSRNYQRRVIQVPNETNKGEQTVPKRKKFEKLSQNRHIASSE